MEPHVSIVTLGVADVAAARRFYVEGLGWPTVFEAPGDVVFIQVGHGLLLALWDVAELTKDIGAGLLGNGPAPISLAHNVGSEQAVRDVLAAAEAAGATVLKPAQRAIFGGLQGYFADPDGFRWEVAHNPGLRVDADGRVTLEAVES